MKFDVVTIFPEQIDAVLSSSIIGRARKNKIIELGFANPRDFTKDKHKTVDDRPYGGGPGMIMKAEPLYQAIKKVKKKDSFVVMLGPQGRQFNQNLAEQLACKKHIIFICGHYEGIDHRLSSMADMEISIGDYILTGGELAAAVIIDSVTRLIPGVFKKEEVPYLESFCDGLLEAPQYTRPALWRRKKVPDILLSGNHKEIGKWRRQTALDITKKLRPDLLKDTEEYDAD